MKKIGFNLVLLAMLAGCSSNEDVILPGGGLADEGVTVSFCSGIQTKAVIEEANFPAGAKIGIYGLNADNNTMGTMTWSTDGRTLATNLDNGLYTATALSNGIQELQATNIAKFPAGDNAALVFYAYYPYDATITTPTTGAPVVPVNLATTIADTPDYLYTGVVPTAVTANPINLPFKHAMARLDLSIRKKEADTPDATLTGVTIVTKNGQKGTMSLVDGAITLAEPNDGVTSITSDALNVVIDSTEKGVGVKYLLIPGNDAIEKITLTLQRGDFSANGAATYDILVPAEKPINLQVGKITTLHLVYDPLDANFTTTIDLWSNDDTNYELPVQ